VYRLEQQAFDQRERVSSSAAEDSELVAAVLRKDRKATAEFVTRYADALYRYVRSRLAPRYDQVDDLVQEVFLTAWQSLKQYRGAVRKLKTRTATTCSIVRRFGSVNLEIVITPDGKFLYSLDSGTGTVSIFGINQDGSLTSLGEVGGLSASAGFDGMAAL
jgi:DNA-binding beta-propeller fold protein YncE